jgi:hypothetical protein
MAGLPHFKNSAAGPGLYEPIYLNQFEVIITPPPAVRQYVGFNNSLTLEHVKSVSALPELAGNSGGPLQVQRYKFAERAYAAAKPANTLVKFSIDFELNLNEDNDNYIYNAFRAWANLIFDPMTGAQGLKKDYAGSGSDAAQILITQFNRAGNIFRQFVFSPVFIDQAKFNEQKLDYVQDAIASLTVPFVADRYQETRVGQ